MVFVERRADPRVTFAVELRVDEQAISLWAMNISMGGMFIAADPAAFPRLEVGTHIRVRLLVADLVGAEIDCSAQITRIETSKPTRRSGYALRIVKLDMPNTMRLAKLVAHGQKTAAAR